LSSFALDREVIARLCQESRLCPHTSSRVPDRMRFRIDSLDTSA
jgi:hypothetical protein